MYLFLGILVCLVGLFAYMIYMPGESYSGELPELGDAELGTAQRYENHVAVLCSHPAGRNFIEKVGLEAARHYIAEQFESSGYEVAFQDYPLFGDTFFNVEVTHAGTTHPDEIIVVGAHYDAVTGVPGANDNGSGVAALLDLADRFREKTLPRTIRFVAFVNEEPPHFLSSRMGSYVYAKRVAKEKQQIVAMFALETVGYYSDAPGSQYYPPFFSYFYPNQGNFIAFVGNLRSRSLVTRALTAFRAQARFPSEGIAAPAFIPGINWSDHWSFWKHGYPAIMITDTAPYRYPYYHAPGDTPDKVNYKRMVPLVQGIEKMLETLLVEGMH